MSEKNFSPNSTSEDPLLDLLSEGSPFGLHLKGFEPRQQQLDMMADVLSAYRQNRISLIEAGTGTGKSLAYLIPAILWAKEREEKTLISTATIALQEQLLEKDIPMVAKALGIECKAVLVKGMGNYVCLRKLEDAKLEQVLLPENERKEIQILDAWSQQTADGSRATLPMAPSLELWEKVNAESDSCSRDRCPYFKQCLFFKARKEAQEAHLLVSNHHLLCADLKLRSEMDNYTSPAILPLYQRIVLDEAHHLEDIATEFFADRLGLLELMKLIGRVNAESSNAKSSGKLPALRERLEQFQKQHQMREIANILTRLSIDFPALRQSLLKCVADTFYALDQFSKIHHNEAENMDEGLASGYKFRLRSHHFQHAIWKEEISPKALQLAEELKRYGQAIFGIEKALTHLELEKLDEMTGGIRVELVNLANRLQEASQQAGKLAEGREDPDRVRWIEAVASRLGQQVAVIDARLDISEPLVASMFSKFHSVILCSATLSSGRHFGYVRSRLGLNKELLPSKFVTESLYDSPFDYSKQSIFAVPTDMPEPTAKEFTLQAAKKIEAIVNVSHGNAFVLFTSFSMLKECYHLLGERLQRQGFHLLKQGDESKSSLLQKFKSRKRSILFGTDSFWEGVDVVGEALRCVIIVKIPFQVPTDPIIEGRTESISARGGSPFMDYTLPQAIVKFKQGFGRLIRHRKDRGCVVCLDPRINTKRYGAIILKSLPPSQKFFGGSEQLLKELERFYKETYFLTK